MPGLYGSGPIEPLVKPGENLLLQGINALSLYVVAYIEPLPLSKNLAVDLANGAGLAAAATSTEYPLGSQLDMSRGDLARIRLRLLDDADLYVYQGGALKRYQTFNNSAFLTLFEADETHDVYSSQGEVYIFENNPVYAQAINSTQYTLPQVRVLAWGERYVLSGRDGTVHQSSGGTLDPLMKFQTIQDAREWSRSSKGGPFTVVPVSGWQS